MTRSRQRRDDEKELRREAIIDAAEAVFATAGFAAAKMEDVARQARVSRALVYLYFSSKTELHFAICVRALRLLREQFSAAVAAPRSGYDQVLAIGRCYLAFAHSQPLYFAEMSRFEAHRPDLERLGANERAVLEAGMAVHEVTVGALQAGMRDGTIRTLREPMRVAMTLWGFIHGSIQIAQTKDLVLQQAGIDVEAFLQEAFELGMRTVAAETPLVPRARRPARKVRR